MPDQETAETLRSVNVKMTSPMIRALKDFDANRSRAVRRVIAAILHEYDHGNPEPFEAAVAAAMRSSAKTQKMTGVASIGWRKAIAWIPDRMNDRICEVICGYDLRPADFMRGAVIGFTGEDPTADIVIEGHELWNSDLQEQTDQAEGS